LEKIFVSKGKRMAFSNRDDVKPMGLSVANPAIDKPLDLRVDSDGKEPNP
jgi:hypothetical protein